MKRPIPFLLATTALLSAGLSGCFGSDYSFEANGTQPLIIDGGYSYDGKLVRTAAGGSITIQLDNGSDTGRVEAVVRDQGGPEWRIVFDEFFPSSPTHDGGIREDFYEHGATGNGDTKLPRFFAYAAAWGSATVERDGQPVKEPNTLDDRFPAHLMVSMGKVRDATTYQIYKADGTCCYNPDNPEDGAPASEAGAQAILQVKTASGAFYLHFQFEDLTVTTS